MKKQTLKEVQTLLTKAKSELNMLKKDRDDCQRLVAKKEKEVVELTTTLEKAKARPVVSEHAIVRYFERILEFDIEQIKNQIMDDDLAIKITQLGNGQFPLSGVSHGTAIVKDNVVVTIKD